MLPMSLLRILFRRVSPLMRLKVLNFYEDLIFLLHLLIRPCPVFYSMCLLSCDVDVQLSHQRFGNRPSGLGIFAFSLFGIFASRLSFILFTWSLHARFLILIYLMTSWISQMLRILCCESYLAECRH